ncbi:hypothetical protein Q8F55_008549 [Vanrija albida]|uniref:Uncharacterized protein n=1 Tax=Vanrija albida TaxID=181172 RepID=A0ABR3PR57_9TREE
MRTYLNVLGNAFSTALSKREGAAELEARLGTHADKFTEDLGRALVVQMSNIRISSEAFQRPLERCDRLALGAPEPERLPEGDITADTTV